MSLPNYDAETGIHYGVISQNSVHPEVLWPSEGWEDEGWNDLVDEANGRAAEVSTAIKEFTEWAEEMGVDELHLPVFPDEHELIEAVTENVDFGASNGPWTYEQDGYQLRSTEFELFVIKSPWVTEVRPCSPCFPNAGDLDSPDEETGQITYCLGPEWFEDDQPPYNCWKREE